MEYSEKAIPFLSCSIPINYIHCKCWHRSPDFFTCFLKEKIHFFLFLWCVFVCVCDECADTQRCQNVKKMMSGSLRLELQAIVSYLTRVLETKLGSFGKAAISLNFQTISLASRCSLKKLKSSIVFQVTNKPLGQNVAVTFSPYSSNSVLSFLQPGILR